MKGRNVPKGFYSRKLHRSRKPARREFLAKYESLCREYGFFIEGVGSCDGEVLMLLSIRGKQFERQLVDMRSLL